MKVIYLAPKPDSGDPEVRQKASRSRRESRGSTSEAGRSQREFRGSTLEAGAAERGVSPVA